jgi:hypothetical protein
MKEQEIIDKIKALQVASDFINDLIKKLKDELDELSHQSKEERFLDLIQGLEKKEDNAEYPDSILYLKDGNLIIKIKKDIAYIRYEGFWDVFETEYNMEYKDIQSFMNNMMEKYLDCIGVTTGPFITGNIL